MLERVRKSVIEYYSWEQPLGQRSPLVKLDWEESVTESDGGCGWVVLVGAAGGSARTTSKTRLSEGGC